MLPVLQAAQMRRDDGTDGTLIGGAIAEASDVFENRTDIQASTAADAVKSIALFRIGQKSGAVVVEEDDVPFIRSIGFTGLSEGFMRAKIKPLAEQVIVVMPDGGGFSRSQRG